MAPNMELAFSEHADVYAAWVQLNTSIKAGMDLRRYELATLAAAKRLRSSYCCLAHGKVFMQNFDEPLLDIMRDRESSGLDEVDLAVMAFAEKIVDDACAIEEADRDRLRALGLTEKDIADVVLAATARCFFSKTLDALDVRPDAHYRDLDRELLEVLVVGREIAEA
jgi:alkylhydroperoxidase family enzyme